MDSLKRLCRWLFVSSPYDRKHLTYTHSLTTLAMFYGIHLGIANLFESTFNPNLHQKEVIVA